MKYILILIFLHVIDTHGTDSMIPTLDPFINICGY